MPNAHARRALFDSTVTLLTGLETTGSRVYDEPASAIDGDNLPCLVVEMESEECEPLAPVLDISEGYRQKRLLNIEVTVFSLTAASREDSTLEVEEALMGSSLGRDKRIQGTRFASNADGARRIWSAAVSFEITYVTLSTQPRLSL